MAFSTEQSAEGSVAGGYDCSLSGKMQTNVWLPKGEALVGTSDRKKGESQSYFENYAEAGPAVADSSQAWLQIRYGMH